MLSRRSLFSFLAGVGAAIAGVKPVEASRPKWIPAKDPTPRPSHYMARGTIVGIDPAVGSGGESISLISDGARLISIDSDEGQKILMESAVNVRADGSIRHRQHHPVDFPPKR